MSLLNQELPERETRARLSGSKWHLHPGVRRGNQLTFGERAADRMRNGMGSWLFVFCFLGAMAFWMLMNSVLKLGHPLSSGSKGFDPYPYILLNLVLSTLAGLQAAALLIAAKRADAVASEVALHTLQNTQADTELLRENFELTRQVKANTDRLEDVHRHLLALCEHLGVPAVLAGEEPEPV